MPAKHVLRRVTEMEWSVNLSQKQYAKCVLILCFLSLAGGVAGIRTQQAPVFVAAVLLLVLTTLRTEFALPSFFLMLIFPLLYTGAAFDSVLGYDAQSVTILTNELKKSSWPIEDVIYSGGFPETPFIHIHAVVVHAVSNVPLFSPDNIDQVVVQALLPYVYVVFMLLLSYSIAKRTAGQVRPAVAVLPVILFIPLHYWVSFRRQSAGYLLFALIVYLLLLYNQYEWGKFQKNGLFSLLVVAFAGLVVAHHMSTAQLLLFLGVAITVSKVRFSDSKFVSVGVFSAVTILIILIVIWYLWVLGDRALFFVGIFERLGGLISGTDKAEATIESVKGTPLAQFRTGLSKWVYQSILGGGTMLYAAKLYLSANDPAHGFYVRILVVFGGIIAFLSALGTQGLVIPTTRQMIFFVLIGGVLALEGWNFAASRVSCLSVTNVIILVCLLSLVMVPPYYVSDVDAPRGEKSDRVSDQMYATSVWVGTYNTGNKVSGDAKVFAVLTPITQEYVDLNATRVKNNDLPRGDFVAREKNRETYRGRFPNEGVLLATIPSENLLATANVERSKIYSSGNNSVFRRELPPEQQ